MEEFKRLNYRIERLENELNIKSCKYSITIENEDTRDLLEKIEDNTLEKEFNKDDNANK